MFKTSEFSNVKREKDLVIFLGHTNNLLFIFDYEWDLFLLLGHE